ncbi:MAG: Uma2 family endonuclease [Planctomycetota bacterium]
MPLATIEQPVSSLDAVRVIADTNVVFLNVSWDQYVATRAAVDSKTPITFDQGKMEIMASPVSLMHADDNALLMLLIQQYLIETDQRFQVLMDVTLRHPDIDGGCEPDGCFYIRATPPPRGIVHIDLSHHAAPDLVIEIDLTSHSVDKEPVYFRLGVAEVWRWENQRLQVRALGDDGYVDADASELLPGLPIDTLGDCMRSARTMSQHEVVKRWRDQVKG